MEKIRNEIVVIGGNHHNLLGVVRTLGEKGILSNIIVTNENKYAFVVKSKYVKKYKIVNEQENEIIEALKDYEQLENKAILIPTSDYAEYVIDKNLDQLSKNFIVPNINNEQGKIIELMNKFNQYELFKKYNINSPKTEVLNLKIDNYSEIDSKINYPFILKPILSIQGKKSDIKICRNQNDLKNAVTELQKNKYESILIQEFIEDAMECNLIGYCANRQVYLPGIVEKKRVYPIKKGTVSYGNVIPIENKSEELKKIIDMLNKINYSGLVDIDLFKKGNTYYINEINFRNSGNAYIYSSQNINLAYLWACLVINQKVESRKINKEFYFIDESLERFQLIKRNITFKEWIEARKKSSCYLIKNKKDRRVQIWKNIYAVLRRIDKR